MRGSSSTGQMWTQCRMSTKMASTAVMLERMLRRMEKEHILLSMPVILPMIHTLDQTEMGRSICIMCEYLLEPTHVDISH